METLLQDIRYGLRMLRKSPGFTFVAVLSVGLGIGANTTIFTLVNAVLLRPEPVKDIDRLVAVSTTDVKNKGNLFAFMPVSHPNFEDYRDQNDVFEGMAATSGVAVSLSGNGEPEQLFGFMVTGNYFSLLGVDMRLGRGFLPDEDRTPGTHPVVVLDDGLWKRRFASDPNIVGKTITLNNGIFTVVGVAPPGFKGLNALGGPDLYIPTMMHEQILTGFLAQNFNERRALLFNPFGRLKPGVTMAQANAALQAIAARLERDYPVPNKGRSVNLVPLAQTTINPNFRNGFVLAGGLLMTVVAIVLLIACANVANLLLARAAARRKEIALRLSLGAGRARLVRQLLTESGVLALLGGVLGILIAYWARDLLLAFRPPQFLVGAIDLDLDLRVLLFTLGVSLLTGVLFGLLPAIQASRPDLAIELKDRSGQSGHQRGRLRLKGALVVGQVALSLVSLIGAGLFLRSLRNAQQINPGFEAQNLLTLSFDLGAQRLDQTHGEDYHRRLMEKVKSIPGVQSVALSDNLPMGGGFGRTVFPQGQEPGSGAVGQFVNADTVGMGYFSTLKIPLKSGRDFTEADRQGAPMVVVINEAMARTFWNGQDAVGKRFKFFGDPDFREVIGIAANTKVFTLGEEPQPIAYIPLLQMYQPAMTLNVRTSVDAAGLLPTVRQVAQALEPTMPLTNVETANALISQVLWAPKMGAALLAIFGVLALILAAVGIYGVMSYSVNQRTGEFGLRMALGAQPSDILNLVFRQGMMLCGAGVAIGLLTALLASRFLATLLFNTSPNDPMTFLAIVLILAGVSVVAGYVPARRATRTDPMVALRYE
jgi:putative ABC transport system permease protein